MKSENVKTDRDFPFRFFSRMEIPIDTTANRSTFALWVITLCVGLYVYGRIDQKLSDIAFATSMLNLKTNQSRQYEYLIVSPEDTSFSTTMDLYGDLGWEIAFARRATSGRGYAQKVRYELILKKTR